MYKLLLVLLSLNVFSQTKSIQEFDVRNAKWGMSIETVKSLEQYNKDIRLIDTLILNDEINQILQINSLIINNTETNLFYGFRNNRLVKVSFQFVNIDTTNLFNSVLKVYPIFNLLVSEKQMQPLACWSYENESYKKLSGKEACKFKSKFDVDNVEKIAIQHKTIKKVIYSLENKRSIATFLFNINADNKVTELQFIPSSEVKNTIIDKTF